MNRARIRTTGRTTGWIGAMLLVAPGAWADERLTTTACDDVHPTLAAYQAAFVAEGWTLVEGDARDGAVALPARLMGFVTEVPAPTADAEGLARLLARLEAVGRDVLDGADIYARGEVRAALQVLTKAGEGDVVRCVFVGPALPEVDTLMDTGGAMMTGDLLVVPSERDPKPGETVSRTNGIRLVPAWGEADPLDGLIVSHTLEITGGTS